MGPVVRGAFQFVAEHGCFPKQLGGPVERGMQKWLNAKRLKLDVGKLDDRRIELLDALGDWR